MKIFIRETIFSVILTIILIFIISLLMAFTSISENLILPLTIGAVSLSLLICAYRIAKNKKEKGILYGVGLGALYMVILYIISVFISFDFSVSTNSLIMIFLGILGGAIGGILGVNF